MAKTIQRALGLPFIAAIMAAARENPSLVKKIAGDWLVEEGKRLGSGRPGLQSENEVAGLREAIKHNPSVADAWSRGVLSEASFKTIYVQWFK